MAQTLYMNWQKPLSREQNLELFLQAKLDEIDAAVWRPGCRVFHNANQSIPSGGSGTPLAFNSERFDIGNLHDTVTNNTRLTCQFAGRYLIYFNIYFAVNATGQRQALVRLNGTNVHIANTSALGAASFDVLLIGAVGYNRAAGDYVELLAYQNSGGALSVLTGNNYSPEFGMSRIG